jgi:uncharacterized protein
MVDSRMEEVDLYIVNHHGMASLLLPKGITVISPRGKQFLNETIEELLLSRYLGKMQRKAGMKTKGPSKCTNEDIIKFIKRFENILSNKEGI